MAPEDVVCDLLPVDIVVDAYFPELKQLLLSEEEKLADAENKLAELLEEHGTDGYLDEDNFSDGKLSDNGVNHQQSDNNHPAWFPPSNSIIGHTHHKHPQVIYLFGIFVIKNH